MDKEDEMWKSVYEKLKKQKSQDDIARERRIQQVDGGFFERFGSLLREHSEMAKEEEHKEELRVAAAASKIYPSVSIGENGSEKTEDSAAEDSGGEQGDTASLSNELTTTSDSEQEDRDKSEDYFAVGMNARHNKAVDMLLRARKTLNPNFSQKTYF